MLFVAATAVLAFCSAGILKAGVLENVTTIQVDPTVVTNPDRKLRSTPRAEICSGFNLRAAVVASEGFRKETHWSESTSF